MQPLVRPARPDDAAAAELLYESAAPYYDAYAGSPARARRLVHSIWPKPGHSASFEIAHVAEVDGRVAGVLSAFPAPDADRLARRFLAISLVRLPAWRWLTIARHLRAASSVMPVPPGDALYVDGLAVRAELRRRGIARELLEHAEQLARQHGCRGVALDTGIENGVARALYAACGFEERDERRARDERVARAVGGPGFVSLFRPLRP
ncbi:MAG TPA: GNAT family N-acetyltransferase [Solirubrobacteraceae bacterium]|nr:GNAT family N-acetyltransferase [Solirubrobacteraceae bacterium]